ncbi:MAG: hypothetical protein FJ387_28785 [Verrucomicrobia bacterium]|nr:hypothetical protein [Verrucomicrobiota bacterium]
MTQTFASGSVGRLVQVLAAALTLGAEPGFAGANPPLLGPEARSPAEVDSTSAAPHPGLTLTAWRTEQGLPQNWVECILQTRDGYLWMGTRIGLVRFDGVRFTLFNHENTPAFTNDFCKALAEDLDGNLWVGAREGLLCRRQGAFELYSVKDGLGDNEIAALAVGPDGSVWIGTGGGVGRFVAGRFAGYVNPAVSKQVVYALGHGPDGGLWVGYEEGLWRLEPATGEFTCKWSGPAGDRRHEARLVACLQVDRQGQVWFGTPSGLYRWAAGEVVAFTEHTGLAPGSVRSILEDAQGGLWVVADGELYRFENGRFVSLDLRSRLGGSPLRCLYADREANLWAGSAFAGLARLQTPKVATLTTRDGLCNDEVWSIQQARDGSIWVATGAGISQYRDGTFTTLTTQPDISQVSFRCVLEDRFSHGLWLGAAFRNYWFYDRATGEIKECPKVTAHPQTAVLYQDRATNFWIGAKEGLTMLWPSDSWLIDPTPRTPVPQRYGEEWIFKAERWERVRAELYYRRANRWYQYREIGDLPLEWVELVQSDRTGWTARFPRGAMTSYNVRGILDDRAGTLWFATAGGGLNRLRDGVFSALTTADGLASNVALCLYEDSDSALWIGTQDGLSRLKDGRLATIEKRHGLFDNLVNQILEDDLGYFWMGCHRGLYRVSRSDLDAAADGRTNSVGCIALTESDGLLSGEIHGEVQPSSCKLHDGRLWFPTARGIAVVDPATIRRYEAAPPVVVEEVRARNQRIFADGQVAPSPLLRGVAVQSLGSGQDAGANGAIPAAAIMAPRLAPGSGRVLEFRYTAASFIAPDKIRFKYRMHGYDADWVEAGDRRVAYCTNLRPGAYRFQVIAANHHGVWNPTGATFAFYLAPHFYQTWLFYGLCGLTALLAAYGLHAWLAHRDRQLERLERELALAHERTRISRDIHDDLGAHLTQIGLLTEITRRELGPEHQADRHVTKIAAASKAISQSVVEIVWALNPQNDTLRSLLAYVRKYAAEQSADAGIRLHVDFPDPIPPQALSGEVRHNLFLAIKEALHNVVRHTRATQIVLRARLAHPTLTLELHDNGCGFNPESLGPEPRGNGLTNMRRRLDALGGQFHLCSRPGQGTSVSFALDLRIKQGE